VPRKIALSTVVAFLASVGLSCGGSPSPSAPHPLVGLAITLSVASTTQSSQVPFTVTLPDSGVPANAPFVLEVSFNGSPPSADSTTVPAGAAGFNATLNIPAGLPDGTILLTAVLPAQHDSATATLTVKDSVPPSLNFAFIPASSPHIEWQASSPFLTSTVSNDSLAFSARDNHAVARIGYQIGAPASVGDSISFNDSSAAWRTPLTLAPALAGTSPSISVFAVNADGYRTQYDIGALMIGQYVDRPVVTAPVDSSVIQLVYDAKRNVVYLPQADNSSIAVLSLASMTYQTSIPLPAAPGGLDITASGDTLVVALLNTADLAFVDLKSDALLGTVHLHSLDANPGDTTHLADVVDDVRVAGDGLILVPMNRNTPGESALGLVQLNRVSGIDSIISINAYWPVAPAKSVDGTKVLLTNAMIPVSGSTSYAAIYDAVAHAYVPIPNVQTNQSLETPAVADQTGSHYLVGELLFDGNMQSLGAVGPYYNSYATIWGSTISPSGSDAYVSIGKSYLRFHVPQPTAGLGGQLEEIVGAPDQIRGMWVTPDAKTLIALGVTTIMRFDLTQSTPHAQRVRIARREPSRIPARVPARLTVTLRSR
jgi:hypothetical protein